MNLGYVKVGAYTPTVKVGDVDFNVSEIKKGIDIANKKGVKVLAFPELSISGYTAGDLFYSKTLLDACLRGVKEIAKYLKQSDMVVFVGLPFMQNSNIYNACACVHKGEILGIVPKSYLPNYNEFYEKRYFVSAREETVLVDIDGKEVPFGTNVLFCDKKISNLVIAVELCEDVWTPIPPSIYHAVNGARVIVNLSTSDEFSGKPKVRVNLVKGHSSKIASAYVYANSGYGESTNDCVFSGHTLICEDGAVLSENPPFKYGLNQAEIDLDYIDYKRSKTFNQDFKGLYKNYEKAYFEIDSENSNVERVYNKTPFIKKGEEDFLLEISAQGLMKRIEHTNAKKLVLGLSGGLDSTLALITCARAMKNLSRPASDIIAITMPCFGTSGRTFDNSVKLAKAFGVTLKKIEIAKSVSRHLKDIKHPDGVHDASYENAQARERTQVLMDYANMVGGLVVGTGDLSELTLGWATYNGDHMSMYAVNASIPKTLVRRLVEFTAENSKPKLKGILLDVLDTPVSPELLPTSNDKISQVTEDIVGPYILHDFFLYHFVKNGASPKKIYYSAVRTFKGDFDSQTILKWLKTFIRRFFSQQFKRSCLPDGVKVSEISLSPRGAWKMPSDAICALWLNELEEIE